MRGACLLSAWILQTGWKKPERGGEECLLTPQQWDQPVLAASATQAPLSVLTARSPTGGPGAPTSRNVIVEQLVPVETAQKWLRWPVGDNSEDDLTLAAPGTRCGPAPSQGWLVQFSGLVHHSLPQPVPGPSLPLTSFDLHLGILLSLKTPVRPLRASPVGVPTPQDGRPRAGA